MTIPALEAQAMMQLYEERRAPVGSLSRLFAPVPGSTGRTTRKVQWDAVRYTEKIAGTVDANTGPNLNKTTRFTSKEIEFAEFSEATALTDDDLINRMAGEDPYAAGNRIFAARFADHANLAMVENGALIDKAMEKMAADALTTGLISMDGARPYTADFKPKAGHFPTVGTAWSDPVNAAPLTDIAALADVIRSDSKKRVTRAYFGTTAMREFLACNQVTQQGDLRRVDMINIAPRTDPGGAHFYGTVIAGGYTIELWLYDLDYEPFAGGSKIPYLAAGKVILLPDRPDFRVCSAVVPRAVPPDPRVASLVSVPFRSEGGWDLTPNIWTDPQGRTVFAGVETRAVLVPAGIDEFGCLTT